MALITRSTKASLDASTGMYAQQITGLVAGEALDLVAACRIRTDGKVYMTDATALDASSRVHGFTARAVESGQPVTLFGVGARFRYADSGLTPGAPLYAAATAGRLDDAATTGDPTGTAFCVDETDIMIFRAGLNGA